MKNPFSLVGRYSALHTSSAFPIKKIRKNRHGIFSLIRFSFYLFSILTHLLFDSFVQFLYCTGLCSGVHSDAVNQNNPQTDWTFEPNRIGWSVFELSPHRSCTAIISRFVRLSFLCHSIFREKRAKNTCEVFYARTRSHRASILNHTNKLLLIPLRSIRFGTVCSETQSICLCVCECGNGRVHQQHSNTQRSRTPAAAARATRAAYWSQTLHTEHTHNLHQYKMIWFCGSVRQSAAGIQSV